ncbi:MAG: hypothetical protein WDN69_21550 [Aliidongia sp.]
MKAVAKAVEEPKPIFSPISVTDIAGLAMSRRFACSIRSLVWYLSGRHSKRVLEGTAEMERCLANQLRQAGEFYPLGEMLFDIRSRDALLPRPESTAHRRPARDSAPLETPKLAHKDHAQRPEIKLISLFRLVDQIGQLECRMPQSFILEEQPRRKASLIDPDVDAGIRRSGTEIEEGEP